MPRSQQLQALQGLSSTLREGIPAAGRGRLAAESLLNTQAKDRYAMDRQKEMDELVKPGLELQRDADTREAERLKQPVTLSSISGGNLHQMGHLVSKGKGEGDKDMVFNELATIFGAKGDEDQNSPTYGNMVKPDGTFVNQGEWESRNKETSFVLAANTDVIRHGRDNLEQLQTYKAATKKAMKQGETVDPNYDEEMINDKIEKLKHFLNAPALQTEAMKKQIQYLSKFRGPGYEKAVARVQKKIAKLEGAEAQKAEIAYKKAQTKLAKSHASYYDRMPQAGKGSEASLKFTKEKRQLINDTMRHLGNNLGFGEGWGDMASMDDNQREAHRNYFPLVGAMAEKGMYDGNPVLLGDAAMATSEMIDAEVDKRAEKLSESRLEEKGITREQWAQQAKAAMMEQAINRLATQPAIKGNKFEFEEGDLEDIKNATPGKGLSLKGTGRGAAAGLQGVAKSHEAFSHTPIGKTLGLPAINFLATKGWDASTVVGDLMVDAGSDVADAVKWLFTPVKNKKK